MAPDISASIHTEDNPYYRMLSRLDRHRLGDVIHSLPGVETIHFGKQWTESGLQVTLQLGISLDGEVYACSDGSIFSQVSYSRGEQTAQEDLPPALPLNLPAPFSWHQVENHGLESPQIRDEALALLQMYFLMWAAANAYTGITLPEPDFQFLVKALRLIQRSPEYFNNMVRNGSGDGILNPVGNDWRGYAAADGSLTSKNLGIGNSVQPLRDLRDFFNGRSCTSTYRTEISLETDEIDENALDPQSTRRGCGVRKPRTILSTNDIIELSTPPQSLKHSPLAVNHISPGGSAPISHNALYAQHHSHNKNSGFRQSPVTNALHRKPKPRSAFSEITNINNSSPQDTFLPTISLFEEATSAHSDLSQPTLFTQFTTEQPNSLGSPQNPKPNCFTTMRMNNAPVFFSYPIGNEKAVDKTLNTSLPRILPTQLPKSIGLSARKSNMSSNSLADQPKKLKNSDLEQFQTRVGGSAEKLPGLSDLIFSRHSRQGYVSVRLFIGKYTDERQNVKDLLSFAYLRPTDAIGGGSILEVWADNGNECIPIEAPHVKNHKYAKNHYKNGANCFKKCFPFNRTDGKLVKNSKQKFSALVMYCFLLAAGAAGASFDQYRVPFREDAARDLVDLCSEIARRNEKYAKEFLGNTDGMEVEDFSSDVCDWASFPGKRHAPAIPDASRQDHRGEQLDHSVVSEDSDDDMIPARLPTANITRASVPGIELGTFVGPSDLMSKWHELDQRIDFKLAEIQTLLGKITGTDDPSFMDLTALHTEYNDLNDKRLDIISRIEECQKKGQGAEEVVMSMD